MWCRMRFLCRFQSIRELYTIVGVGISCKYAINVYVYVMVWTMAESVLFPYISFMFRLIRHFQLEFNTKMVCRVDNLSMGAI